MFKEHHCVSSCEVESQTSHMSGQQQEVNGRVHVEPAEEEQQSEEQTRQALCWTNQYLCTMPCLLLAGIDPSRRMYVTLGMWALQGKSYESITEDSPNILTCNKVVKMYGIFSLVHLNQVDW